MLLFTLTKTFVEQFTKRSNYLALADLGGRARRAPPHLPGILVLMIFWDILYKIIFL